MVTTRFMQLLLEALALPPNGRRSPSRLVSAVTAVAICLLTGGVALTIWTLAQADGYGRRTGDWSRLSAAQMLIVPCYYHVAIPPAALLDWNKRQMRLLRPLRDTLITGAAQFAPSMPVAPLPFPESRTTPSRRHVVSALAARPLLGPIVTGALVGALPLWLLILFRGLPRTIVAGTADMSSTSTFDLVASLTPLMFMITQFIVVSFLLGRRQTITTDEEGISWRQGWNRRKGRIPWINVKAFYIARHQRAIVFGRQECLAHVLVTEDNALGWIVPASAKPAVHYDMWRLASDIEAHTGQSPRDLSVLRAIADREIQGASQLAAVNVPFALGQAIERAYSHMTRRFWGAIALAVILALPLFVLSFRLLDYVPPPPRSYTISSEIAHEMDNQAGLLLVNGSTTGEFTNFAAYPVKPRSSLRYV